MRILYVATVGGFMPFFKELVRKLLDEGHVVDFAANQSSSKVPDYYKDWGCRVFDISCSRSPLSIGNIKAIKEIRNIAKNYDVVHCHTPLAGMATRLGCKKLRKKQGLKVIYTAHGFHFYKGAPKKNWLIYYPIEMICSRWTDVLITINREDYELARIKMKAKKVEYVPGVGVHAKEFAGVKIDSKEKRMELGVPENAFLVLSVGELNDNKNHQTVIKAISQVKELNIFYVIAGVGDKKTYLESLAKELNVNLKLLGYRKDVKELYKAADLFIHPSYREGLPVALMEALASNCSCIASDIRGNVDLVPKNYCFNPYDYIELAGLISKKEGSHELNPIYDSVTVNQSMIKMYKEIIK